MAYPHLQPSSIFAAFRRAIPAGIAAFGLLALAPTVMAQATGADPTDTPRVDTNEGFGSTDSSGGIFGESSSPFDLIHRAVLMNETSLSDFNRQHRGRITSEAANYRTLQQEALRRQAQPEAVESPTPVIELEPGAE